jgi:hypothetical protein
MKSTRADRIRFYERKTARLYRMRGGRHRLRRLARLTLYRCALDRLILSHVKVTSVQPDTYERLRTWWVVSPQ